MKHYLTDSSADRTIKFNETQIKKDERISNIRILIRITNDDQNGFIARDFLFSSLKNSKDENLPRT